jgi:hypothetical protein
MHVAQTGLKIVGGACLLECRRVHAGILQSKWVNMRLFAGDPRNTAGLCADVQRLLTLYIVHVSHTTSLTRTFWATQICWCPPDRMPQPAAVFCTP